MKKISVIIVILATFLINVANAQSVMRVKLTTGGDDLRGGNNAYITVNYSNGTTSKEYLLGGGFANGATTQKNITLDRLISSISEISNIIIRHDGSPRAGNPFDTYDNWDLKAINVTFQIGRDDVCFANYSGNPDQRFTGSIRNKTYKANCNQGGGGGTSSTIKVYTTTGSDDLRGGNNCFVTLNFTNGLNSSEFRVGGGFGQNSANTKTIDTGNVININDIKSITLRHDGSPRAGNSLDTYDNWDLHILRVVLVMPNGTEQNIVNASGNPLKRFTGAVRTLKVDKSR